MAPEKEGSRVKGEAGKVLQEILDVDECIHCSMIHNEVEHLGRRLVKNVQVGDASLCEEQMSDLAADPPPISCIQFDQKSHTQKKKVSTGKTV